MMVAMMMVVVAAGGAWVARCGIDRGMTRPVGCWLLCYDMAKGNDDWRA